MKKKTLICTLIATAIVAATVAIGCSYSASQNGDNETNESEQVTTVNDSEQAEDKSEQVTTVNDSEIKSDATEKETKVENNTDEEMEEEASKIESDNKQKEENGGSLEQQTEAPTEAATEAPTEPSTEAPTEAPTEQQTEDHSDWGYVQYGYKMGWNEIGAGSYIFVANDGSIYLMEESHKALFDVNNPDDRFMLYWGEGREKTYIPGTITEGKEEVYKPHGVYDGPPQETIKNEVTFHEGETYDEKDADHSGIQQGGGYHPH